VAAQVPAFATIVRVSRSELEGKALPAICAMTGNQAEVWRRFRFATTPPGSRWESIGVFSVSKEHVIIGYLPLTQKGARLLAAATWIPVIAIAVGTMAAVASAVTVGGALLLLGFTLAITGGLVLLLSRPFVGPQGKVMEEGIVELSRVNPAFVSAVRAIHNAI
jgi:hypothetical protein